MSKLLRIYAAIDVVWAIVVATFFSNILAALLTLPPVGTVLGWLVVFVIALIVGAVTLFLGTLLFVVGTVLFVGFTHRTR